MTNYQLELDRLIASLGGRRPTLLLHACCAPCASYVLEYLAPLFDVTLYYYNPSIQPFEEYELRLSELRRMLTLTSAIPLIIGEYDDPEREWGDCRECQSLRLARTADLAASGGFEYFCTTLSISPHKNAALLNELGRAHEQRVALELERKLPLTGAPKWLPSDFKKRGGFQRSVELCRELGIYRQSYCGCLFSGSR